MAQHALPKLPWGGGLEDEICIVHVGTVGAQVLCCAIV